MSLSIVKKLHKNIYRKAKSEAQNLTGDDNYAIIEYSKKFERSLPNKFKKIERSEFFSAVADAKIILYGDFHTLKQSQKGCLSLIEALAHFHPHQKRLLALETFRATDQALLEMYMAKKINERAFLRKIKYEKTWGFPWENYGRLLKYTQKEKIPVFGINADEGGSVKQRDYFLADMLAKLAKRYSDYQIICLVGEYHLADQQLPAMLKKKMQPNKHVTRVVSNIDHYYFNLNYVTDFEVNHYLYLKKNLYCIMNTPPWIKWQSYTFWEELRENSSTLDGNVSEFNEIKIDLDYYILSLVFDLTKFLKFTTNPITLNRFNVLHGTPEKIIKQAQQKKLIPTNRLKTAVVRMALDDYYYVDKTNSIFLTKVSPNSLAEATGQFIYETVSQSEKTNTSTSRFYRRIIRFSLSVLCSKIINPKRKLTNFYKYMDIATRSADQEQRAIAKEIVRFHNWMQFRIKERDGKIIQHLRRTIRMDENSDFEISKSLGKIIGVLLYREVIGHKNPPAIVHSFFRSSQRPIWKVVVDMYRFFL